MFEAVGGFRTFLEIQMLPLEAVECPDGLGGVAISVWRWRSVVLVPGRQIMSKGNARNLTCDLPGTCNCNTCSVIPEWLVVESDLTFHTSLQQQLS